MKILIFALTTAAVFGQEIIRIHSNADNRDYTIDTTKVGDTLKPVGNGAAAALSRWLYPHPNAVPERANYNVERRVATATFRSGGSVAQVAVYYSQILSAQGLRVSTQNPKRGGTIVTGSSSAEAVTVHVDPKPGYIEVRISEALKGRAPARHFEAVWYDDVRGILRLRDTSTGNEYEMTKRDILAHNLNQPGGVTSRTVAMPTWLPVFPGAQVAPKGINWNFEITAGYVSQRSIREVFD